MKITAFGKTKEYPLDTKIIDVLKDYKKNYLDYCLCKINNVLHYLGDELYEDCEIEFLDLSTREAMYIYQSTLRYIMAYAMNELYPKSRLIFNYSISRSFYAQPVGIKEIVDEAMVKKVSDKIQEIVDKDLPIVKKVISMEKAKKIFQDMGLKSKVKLMNALRFPYTEIYELNGYYNYMYSILAPSTGFIKKFRLHLFSPGIIVQYPRAELNGEIPEFVDEAVLGSYLKEANKWGQITGASYIADYNKIVEEGNAGELIALCEARHSYNLSKLADNILAKIDEIKIVGISGPSSSGKTTFTNRLRIELTARGIKPLMISLDNYYRDDEKYPQNPDGTPDYEDVEALDLDLINDNFLKLINGESVELPIFDFKTHKRSFTKPVKLSKNQVIMIEGIHALNPILTRTIPPEAKYNVYIAPQAQLHIDSQSPISMTDIRLIRRIVRDYRERNSDPKKTMEMWSSVRRGEFKWIYPYQEEADFVFNTELTYELGAMRKIALQVLAKVKKTDKEFILATKLLNILSVVQPIDEKLIPSNSLIREFIGGSLFYEK